MRLRKESSKGSVVHPRREAPPDFANLTVDLLKPVQHSKRYAITNVDSLGVIERFTYTEITREAARWAQLLREKGLQPGDRVVIVAGREWGWRCALLGAIHAGGVAVPCPASLSPREIGTVVEHAGASLLVSLRPGPDLVEVDGLHALTADDVDAVDPARALAQPPHQSEARDIALILYAWHGLDLTGAMHTHASLLAQADAAEHWLGVDEDERIWATADDGSGPSIWLLLAAWRRAASIVVVDLELDSEAKLELLDRLRPAAVWFSDDEYGMLGSTDVPPWVDLRSIRRAFVDTEETEGVNAFVAAFGAALVPVFALDELGVVAGWPAGHEGKADATTAHPTPGVQVAVVGGDGTELPPGEVGDVVVRSDAPTLFTGYAGREGRSRSAGWFRFGWRGALTAEGALRIEARSASEVEPVGASVDLPVPEVAEEPAPEEHVAAEPEPAALGWRARRTAERARREEEHAAEEEQRRSEEAQARESAEREAVEAAAREREAVERREHEEAEARDRAEREAAAEAERAEEERLAEARRVAEQEQQRDEEQRQRMEEEARRRAEQEAKQRAEEAQRRDEERRREEEQARERQAREAKEREKAEAGERRRAEQEAKAQQAAAAAEAKQRAGEEKSREKERQREEKEARARAEREAKEREKAEAEERRRAEEEAKIQAKRAEAEAKQRDKEEKEREQREAKERSEREKAEAEAAKAQAKIDAAAAKQRAKEEKEREKREAVERAEREKAEAEAAKVRAKLDAAEAKQRAKDEQERQKREAAERAEREKAEAEAAKAKQKQDEVDAKKRAEEEKRSAKEREREAKEAQRRAEEEAKEAARAERKAARKEKRRPPETPKPAGDGERRFGRRREAVEETEPQHVPDVVARIQQYGLAAASNDRPAEPPEEPDDE